MPVNRNALIRYKTIDQCLRNHYRKWTLDDLIEQVSEALYEFEGIDKGISRRSVQADIQMMRSDKLGYNAPIVVRERKYYAYEDKSYSIMNIPISEQDIAKMNEAVELLKQFKGFSHFAELTNVVQKLEAQVYEHTSGNIPVIDFEKNEGLKGLELLDDVYRAITQKQTLTIRYKSFKARGAEKFTFHAWWLKEFKNRWFVIGKRENHNHILTLALDRIQDLRPNPEKPYEHNPGITPADYYKDVIGVTVGEQARLLEVKLWVSQQNAPYILTKPLHHSQQLIAQSTTGAVISIRVQHNYELERELLGFGPGLKVLSPRNLQRRIQFLIQQSMTVYETEISL